MPPIFGKNTEPVLITDFIEEAISEIKLNSAPDLMGDGIPTILIKKCAGNLSIPIHHLRSESMSSGIFPNFCKIGYVSKRQDI